MELNITEWKEFRAGELFKVSKTKDDSKNTIIGETPYISRKGINNGIVSYHKTDKIEKNCLTIHSEWSKQFICFYQDGEFCADGKIVKMENINLNKFNGLFIATIFSQINTSDYRLDTIKNEIIKLPVDTNGNPDWKFMEEYIKDIKFPKINMGGVNVSNIPLNINQWKNFKIKDIFNSKIGNISKITSEKGTYPLISCSMFNNGIVGTSNDAIFSNSISVATNGTCGKCFYQKGKFAASIDTIMLFNKKLNEYNGVFIDVIIEKNLMPRYTYGNKNKGNKTLNTIIKLPVDTNGNPDWKFMEEYIKGNN